MNYPLQIQNPSQSPTRRILKWLNEESFADLLLDFLHESSAEELCIQITTHINSPMWKSMIRLKIVYAGKISMLHIAEQESMLLYSSLITASLENKSGFIIFVWFTPHYITNVWNMRYHYNSTTVLFIQTSVSRSWWTPLLWNTDVLDKKMQSRFPKYFLNSKQICRA